MTRKILIVAAHPDDEVLGCAGVSAKNVMAGDEVHVLFMTNGVDARNEDSEKELERQTAMQKALDIVGISSVQKLNLPDNKMDSIPLLEIIKLIEEIIKKINPKAKTLLDKQRVRPKSSEVMQLLGSNKRVKKLTGWKPKYSFDKGLDETIEWFRNSENLKSYKSGIYNV